MPGLEDDVVTVLDGEHSLGQAGGEGGRQRAPIRCHRAMHVLQPSKSAAQSSSSQYHPGTVSMASVSSLPTRTL